LCLFQGAKHIKQAKKPGQSIHFSEKRSNHGMAAKNGRMSVQEAVQTSKMAEGDAELS
jgi:hypothetical protein